MSRKQLMPLKMDVLYSLKKSLGDSEMFDSKISNKSMRRLLGLTAAKVYHESLECKLAGNTTSLCSQECLYL